MDKIASELTISALELAELTFKHVDDMATNTIIFIFVLLIRWKNNNHFVDVCLSPYTIIFHWNRIGEY